MELKIVNTTDNPLLARKEITATAAGPKTPSNNEVKEFLASKENTKADNVIVKKITTHFGKSNSEISAVVYKTTEDLKRVESYNKKKEAALAEQRKKEAEEKAAAEAAKKEEEAKKAEEAKAEAEKPAEETKDAAPEEKTEEPVKEEAKEASESKSEEKKEE